jgi:hypothetical protein
MGFPVRVERAGRPPAMMLRVAALEKSANVE